jgi:hypothetical protein
MAWLYYFPLMNEDYVSAYGIISHARKNCIDALAGSVATWQAPVIPYKNARLLHFVRNDKPRF